MSKLNRMELKLKILDKVSKASTGKIFGKGHIGEDPLVVEELIREGYLVVEYPSIKVTHQGETLLIQHKIKENLEEGSSINKRMENYTKILIVIGVITVVSSFAALKDLIGFAGNIAYILIFILQIFGFYSIYKILKNIKREKQ